jgi:hypothetical protein
MLLAVVLAAATAVPSPATAPPLPCCFIHPNYAGTCVVVPTEKETCETILAYLNAPNSTGKIYCNSTRLRGRWKGAPCSQSKAPSAAGPQEPEPVTAGSSPRPD